MCTMPKAFPAEFHRDVVAVARKREAPISQVGSSKDFGISEATLHAWLKKDDIEEGACAGPPSISDVASTQNDVPAGHGLSP
jgi:transposase